MIMINWWPSKYLVLARCVVFIRFDCTLIAEDSLRFLFWSPKKESEKGKKRKEKKRKRKKKNVRMIHIRSTSCWFKTTKKTKRLPKKQKQNIEYGILAYYPITVVIEGWFTFAFPLAFPRILICICAQEGRHLLSKILVICVPIY